MAKITSILNKVHWVWILVFPGLRPDDMIDNLRWDNLSFELRLKYDWYFKYRAALLQVKYPKARIEFRFGHQDAEGKSLDHIKANRITAKKRKITELINKLEKDKKSWAKIFPIEEDILYKKASAKVERLEQELQDLINN
jgi:hypothetical protein